MNWCLLIFILLFWVDVNRGNETGKQEYKFRKYKKCMENYGISTRKIVDNVSNATFYETFNYQWNKIFDPVSPIAIFVPSSVCDVQATVKCGFNANIQLVPNSGGHSYAGLSLGTNDSIIVDFRFMISIDINHKEGSVTIGPAAFVGHIDAKLWKNGGWGFPLGNCMTMALGGHALGGGYGFFSPLYGLVIDNILEIKMVDARGNAVTVNPKQNRDLWWAMRGVGPGYIGLVTSYKLKMFKAKDLKLTSVAILYKLKDFQNVMERYFKWLDWVKQNEPSVATIIIAVNDNYKVPGQFVNPGLEVKLLHIQDPEIQPNSSTEFLAVFPKFFPPAIRTIISNPSYIEVVVAINYTPVRMPPSMSSADKTLAISIDNQLEFFSTLTKEMSVPRYSFEKSFFINRQFRARDLNEVQKVLSEIPNFTSGVMITSEQGAVGAPRSTDSAYVHRDAICDVRIRYEGLKFEEVTAGKMWMDKFVKTTRFMDSGRTYQNFPDIQLKDYLFRYYGSNLEKLIRIKQKWDPRGYFHSVQSIPTFIDN